MPETLIPEDLSEKQLKWGYWFVTHAAGLKRALAVALIAVIACAFAFSGYRLYLDFADAANRERMMIDLAGNWLGHETALAQSPKPLSVGGVQILAAGGKYDFAGELTNPNQHFWGHFSYRFAAEGFATPWRKGFILPGESKYAVELGASGGARPAGAYVEISGLVWKRVDRHAVPDWPAYRAARINFEVSDISHDEALEISPGKSVGKTAFTLKNSSGFGYYDLRCLVLMYRGPALVGINYAVFPQIMPGQPVDGEVTWYESLGAVTQIKVIPEIDITDPGVYLNR